MALRLKRVPARQGTLWVARGFRAFVQRPLGFSAMLAAFLFASLVLVVVPVLGGLLTVMALPLLTLGFMIGTQAALKGDVVHPGMLLQPLRGARPSRPRLLLLCALYGVATLLLFTLCGWLDGGAFNRLVAASSADAVQAELAEPAVQWALWLRMGGAALLSVPFWHAPALVHWGGQGVAQSLFSSTLALWRTRGAFLTYTLAWGGLLMAFSVLTGVLFMALGAPQMIGVALLPGALMFSTVFYVSLFFTFTDSFELTPPRETA
jgi:hypothetical protein